MELDIKENGKLRIFINCVGLWGLMSDKAKVHRFGLTGPCMRAGGKTIKPMARDVSSTLMVTSTMAHG